MRIRKKRPGSVKESLGPPKPELFTSWHFLFLCVTAKHKQVNRLYSRYQTCIAEFLPDRSHTQTLTLNLLVIIWGLGAPMNLSPSMCLAYSLLEALVCLSLSVRMLPEGSISLRMCMLCVRGIPDPRRCCKQRQSRGKPVIR